MKRFRLWVARVFVAAIATIVALKVGDLLVGGLLNTQQRHLLRLPGGERQRHRSTEFDYTFTTNRLGLRGPQRDFAKPHGTRRVVVLGDSFVAGYGVPDEAVFTMRLETLLDADSRFRSEVINVGRNGTSTIRELDLYTLIGRRFQPDIVVLAYYLGNDLREVVEEHDQEELRRWHPQGSVRRSAYALFPNLYLELALLKMSADARSHSEKRTEGQVLATLREQCRDQGADYQAAEMAYRRLPEEVQRALADGLMRDHHIFAACYDPGRIKRSLDPDDKYFEKAWPRTERHLALLQRAVAADGAKFTVMIIPDAVQVDSGAQQFAKSIGYEVDPAWRSGSCRTEQAVLDWSERAKVPALDLTEFLRQAKEPVYYPQDGHFNAAGHQRTAELLAEFLTKLVTEIPTPRNAP